MPAACFCRHERSIILKRYSPKEIEPRWAKIWDETGVYTTDLNSNRPKYIGMSMFPYPSGAGIHIGHAMNYTISDVKARFKRQQGFESYHPVGWDAFGLPAENYAIKVGVSPQESMADNIATYTKQYKAMGWSNDWEKEISTHLPEYYKWSQWIFTQMYKHGLAYQDSRMQWWCPIDNTVLANEQVIDGKCWRHDGPDDPPVEKKEIKQWFFKITDYADELLEATDALDWTESVKLAQKNWIGKSVGAEIDFSLHKVCNPNSDVARTYIMGQKNISEKDIQNIGGRVENVTDKGYLRVEFPLSRTTEFEKLINEKMEPGFWNEYLTNEKVVFIFKYKDGRLERLELNDENAHQICIIGNQFNNDPPPQPDETAWQWLENNSWYAPIVPKIRVFTTRPDTIFGATFLVLAPEHELVPKITSKEQKKEVDEYVKKTLAKSELERQESKEKTGVFTGAYAVNPANNEKIPIWIADYVLTGYGTGAIMAVPAHDQRDFEFAKKYGLPITEVIEASTFDEENPPRDGKENTKRNVAICVIKNKDDKYLTLKWNKLDWQNFVMGGVEDGEELVEAAKREIAEETGYTDVEFKGRMPFALNSIFYAAHKDVNRDIRVDVVLFELKSDKQEAVKHEEHEDFEPVWIEKSKLKNLHPVGGLDYIVRWIEDGDYVYDGEGRIINSGEYDGLNSADAREKIVVDLAKQSIAQEKINYRMRDWSVSRQRYWGAPIPIIYCPKCGPQLVPDEELPVVLPELTDFKPSGDGRSALARAKNWLKVDCPKCHGPAERETDTLDTYVDSSFYMYRYMDPHNQEQIFDSKVANKWTPIDFYNGADHATAHLLYARFIGHFFKKIGLVDEPEPFKQFLFNGKVSASDGSAFSKSKGNGVDPLEIINQGYGADALRTYLMFAAPLELGARWDPQGVPGTYRFLNRLWNLVQEYTGAMQLETREPAKQNILRATNRMIKKVTEDIEANHYNTAIAAMMECVNDFYKLKIAEFGHNKVWRQALENLVACAAPFAPFIAEELWQQLGHSSSVHKDSWPKWDEKYLASTTIKIAVQVNGKLRGEVEVPAGADESTVTNTAKNDEKVSVYLSSKEVRKTVYVPGRLVNFVVS